MATAKKTLNERIRNRYMETVKSFLADKGEEILVTGTNEFAMPCVDDEGNDEFIVITFKVPTGSRDGDAYAMAEDFAMKQKDKAEKAKVAAAKKAEKIARDKAMREAKAKSKAEHLAKTES